MSNLYNRLAKLEERDQEQPYPRPQVFEIWGTHEDGTRYLMEAWQQSENSQWRKIVVSEAES